MRNSLLDLPPNLPIPEDDGQCSHLLGVEIPDIELASTNGTALNLKKIFKQKSVLFSLPT
jgi:hypothetical protein